MEVDARLARAPGVEGSEEPTPAVVLVVESEAGVRRFEAGVAAPEGVGVETVAPGDLADRFEVTAGGAGEGSVEARSIGFVGAGREPPVVSLGVRLSEPVDPASVGFTARRLVGHDEAEVDGSAVRVASATHTERL